MALLTISRSYLSIRLRREVVAQCLAAALIPKRGELPAVWALLPHYAPSGHYAMLLSSVSGHRLGERGSSRETAERRTWFRREATFGARLLYPDGGRNRARTDISQYGRRICVIETTPY